VFSRKVRPGCYPVTLLEAQGRVAAAVLRFGTGLPMRWELAAFVRDVSTSSWNAKYVAVMRVQPAMMTVAPTAIQNAIGPSRICWPPWTSV